MPILADKGKDMDEWEVIFYSVIALLAGLLLVRLAWENVKLKDELEYRRQNSVDLSRVPPEFIPAAKDECFRQIEVFKCKSTK